MRAASGQFRGENPFADAEERYEIVTSSGTRQTPDPWPEIALHSPEIHDSLHRKYSCCTASCLRDEGVFETL
jgi:hypothetical protein